MFQFFVSDFLPSDSSEVDVGVGDGGLPLGFCRETGFSEESSEVAAVAVQKR